MLVYSLHTCAAGEAWLHPINVIASCNCILCARLHPEPIMLLQEISSNSACTADRHGGATQKESMLRPIIQRSPTQHSTDDSMPDNHSAPSSGDASQEHKTADRLPSWSETSMSSAAPAPPQSSSAKRVTPHCLASGKQYMALHKRVIPLSSSQCNCAKLQELR